MPRQEVHADHPRAVMRLAGLGCVVLAACAAGPAAVPRRAAPPAPSPVDVRVEPGEPSWLAARPEQQAATIPPSVLRPVGTGDDAVVAQVGDVRVRKSDVYDRMLENDRRRAQLWVDLLVLDAVVADMAVRFGITVAQDEIAQLAADEEKMLRAQVEADSGEQQTLESYLDRQFGLTPDEYQRFLRQDLARTRYRGLVMRYVAMLEDRVEVRFMVHPDRAVLEDARQKVARGADFAALAKRLSEDDTRTNGGLLPPFGLNFRHPIAQVAFGLDAGALSDVVTFESRGRTRFALVYCLRRLPRRDVVFADVRDEIVAELTRAPITPFEQNAFVVQYCRPTSALDSATEDR